MRNLSSAKEHLNQHLIEYQKKISETVTLAAVGEFSFGFAHDLGSPIMLLGFYTNQLNSIVKDKYPEEKELLNYCTAIDKASERMTRLQTVFRSIARGSQELTNIKEINLNESIANFVDLYTAFFEKNAIEVVCPKQGENFLVETYDGAVETILLNVVQNATNVLLKCPHRRITISVEAKDECVVLAISDSGPGIDQERAQQMWKLFGSSNRGSGFGLYHVKRTAERMTAHVDVQSNANGTAFIFEIPRKISTEKKLSAVHLL